MAHGNKKYFFEELKSEGDTILAKPSPGQKRVNPYSLKNQIRSFFKIEANKPEFDTELIENNNGTITVKRLGIKQPTPCKN